jgi:hypothetical protein
MNIITMAKESGITAHEPVTPDALTTFAKRAAQQELMRCCDVLREMHEVDKERHNYYLHALSVLKMLRKEPGTDTDHGSGT